jgi:phosphoglycolate phosphatase
MVADEYDVWLLDLDGTLVDVERSYVHDVCGRVGDRLGAPFSEAEAEALWYGLGDRRRRTLQRYDLDAETFWETFHEEEDPIARAEATYLYDDATVVADLDAPVGVVTHCQPYLTGPVLDRLDVRDWFDAVVCCTDETGWKPDPAPVERALREVGVGDRVATDGGRPADAPPGVLVGDRAADVGAAWNAGLDAVHVERHGPDRRGQCVLGDHRVESFDELL